MLWWTLRQLNSKNADKRRQAIDKLVSAPGSEVVDRLIEALKENKKRNARMAAAEALGIMREPRAADTLASMLGDWHIGKQASEALAQIGEPAINPLVSRFDSYSESARKQALDVLKKVGEPAAQPMMSHLKRSSSHAREITEAIVSLIGVKAQPMMIEALEDKASSVRRAAAKALGKIGDEQAVEPLAAAARDNDGQVRDAAVDALEEIGSFAFDALCEALNDPQVGKKTKIAFALEKYRSKQAIKPLVAALNGASTDDRKAIMEALQSLGWKPANDEDRATYYISLGQWSDAAKLGAAAVEQLISAIENWNESDSYGLMEPVRALGKTRDTRATKTFLKFVTHDNRDLRIAAIEALGELKDAAAVDALTGCLETYNDNVRNAATDALTRIGTASVERLIAALNSNNNYVQSAAAKALGDIRDERAINPLAEKLRRGSQDARAIACALAQFGSKAVEPLIKAIKGNSHDVRLAAIEELGKIKDQRTIPPLAEALSDSDSSVKKAAAAALKAQGWEPATDDERARLAVVREDWDAAARYGSASIAVLTAAMKDYDYKVREGAFNALTRLGRSAIEPLIEMLDSQGPSEGPQSLCGALASFGDEAMPSLVDKLASGNARSRAGAAAALGLMGEKALKALPELIGALSDEDSTVRRSAINAIGNIGPTARKAVPDLIRVWNERGEFDSSSVSIIARMKISDARIADPLLKYLFGIVRSDVASDIEKVLLSLVPSSSLTEDIIRWAVRACTYEHKYRGWKYDEGYITLEMSDGAIGSLCAIKSPVTSNILHLVTEKKDISVTMSTGCSDPWQETVSFESQRQTAKSELERRGNPPYDPLAYLKPADAEAEQLRRESEAEALNEKQRRYRQLLSLAKNPRSELGEDKWKHYEEMARDFKSIEVFRLLVNDLAGYQYIPLGDLTRFEGLLASAGQNLSPDEARSALAPIQAAWPNTCSAIMRRIEERKR